MTTLFTDVIGTFRSRNNFVSSSSNTSCSRSIEIRCHGDLGVKRGDGAFSQQSPHGAIY